MASNIGKYNHLPAEERTTVSQLNQVSPRKIHCLKETKDLGCLSRSSSDHQPSMWQLPAEATGLFITSDEQRIHMVRLNLIKGNFASPVRIYVKGP